MPAIPPRAPIADSFGGALCRAGERYFLAVNPPSDAEIAAQGVVLRYGARLLGKPFLSIVPGLIALERGEMMTGETAWEFLFRRSQLFPRAEVYGYLSDGKDHMLTVKWLDLALTPMVLAYADDSATAPLAEIAALVGRADAFPSRAAEYLPRFDMIEAFLAYEFPE
jgi:hypothetical protein